MILFLCVIAQFIHEAGGRPEDSVAQKSTLLASTPIVCQRGQQLRRPTASEVPENLKPWDTPYPDYQPVHWNETCRFVNCDSEIRPSGLCQKSNDQDKSVNYKRAGTICEHTPYEARDHLPLNPAGRTGLTGRGILPHFGPNHVVAAIFIWEEQRELSILKKSANSSYADAFLLGFVDDPDEQPLPHHILKSVRKSLLEKYKENGKVDRIMNREKKKFLKLLAGNAPSPLETDNAWTELSLFIVPCHKTKLLCKYGLSLMNKEHGLQWYAQERQNNSLIGMDIDETTMQMKKQRKYSIFNSGCMMQSLKWFSAGMTLGAAVSVPTAFAIVLSPIGVIPALLVGGFIGMCMIPPTLIAFSALNDSVV
uniref:Uncharacterized protein n=1 Tax=Trichuris muris TaxID=70415 RepID=A0A5S6QL26_TRIMR